MKDLLEKGFKMCQQSWACCLCIAFGRKQYRKLSAEWKYRNIKDYRRHARAELSAPQRAWAELSQPQSTAETATKGSKRSIRHGRLQPEVQIMDMWADDAKEGTRQLLRSSLSWNSSRNTLSLLPDIPRALSLTRCTCLFDGKISSRDGKQIIHRIKIPLSF